MTFWFSIVEWSFESNARMGVLASADTVKMRATSVMLYSVCKLAINSGGILPIIKTLHDECSYKVESCVIEKNLIQVIMYHPTSFRKFEVLNRKKLINISKILWSEEGNDWYCVVKDENGKKYRELIENCQQLNNIK